MTSPERWAEVQRVLEAVLELPLEARSAYLTSACGNDAALRGEVERLVRACSDAEQANGFLSDPAAEFAAPVVAQVALWESGDATRATARIEALRDALAERYTIERELGHGGMATVFLARDLRHDRSVALKVMKPGLLAAASAERFLREIRIAARLAHPHILPLHDSGEAGGLLYYVMPYVAGESLRDLLAREGPVPVSEAVRILRELASALDYAHRQGIVHRDIKPENILLQDGHAVVADFGIARAVSRALETGESADGAPATSTRASVALGTPAYMAPEQAAGNPQSDHRADLYALGVVAYEMLDGANPFVRHTPEALLAAHLTETPEPLALRRPEVPPDVSELVLRLLAKRPADRPTSAEAVLTELERVATGPVPYGEAVVPGRRIPGWALAAALGVTVVAGVLALLLRPSPPRPYELGRITQVTMEPGLEISPTFSPDGSLVAYLGGDVSRMRLYIRSVTGGAPVEAAPGIDCNPRNPQWSPDGTRILFHCGGVIYSAPVPGGPARLLVTQPEVGLSNATWSPDGTRIVYVEGGKLLKIRDVAGGAAKEIATGNDLHSPAWSHDGRWIAVVSGNSMFSQAVGPGGGGGGNTLGNLAPSRLVLVPAEGGTFQSITDNRFMHMSPVWAPEDRGLFLVATEGGARDIAFLALGRDHRPTGPPRRLTTGLKAASIALSPDGKRMAYSVFSRKAAIWSVPISGTRLATLPDATRLTMANEDIVDFSVSADGAMLAFDSDRSGSAHIWKMPVTGGEPTQITTDPSDDFMPTWSPDGRWIAYHSLHNGNRDLFMISSAGGRARQITTDTTNEMGPRWSPDGNRLEFYLPGTEGGGVNTLTRLSDSTWGGLQRLNDDGGNLGNWSPDGRSLSYVGPARTIRVIPADGGQGRVVLGAFEFEGKHITPSASVWSDDGRELLFNGRDESGWNGVFSVPVSGGTPRLRIALDGWQRSPAAPGLAFRSGRLYFVLATQESDIYVVDLTRNR